MQYSQEPVGSAFKVVSNSDRDVRQFEDAGTEPREALFHCTPGVTIPLINSMQDYKIDASFDVHQHALNAHMYWIPGNMMLNTISGIAPIS